MLKIAAIANSYKDAKSFIEYKFRDKIAKFNATSNIYELTNGDKIYLCYDEQDRHRYLSMEYDAFIIHPLYQSLADVIRHRTTRP